MIDQMQKRGRPVGSKNKPKGTKVEKPAEVQQEQAVQQ
jgi:hypothetical protein